MNFATSRLFILFAMLLLAARLAAVPQDCFSNPYPLKTFLHDNFANTNAGMVVGLLDEHGCRVFNAGKMDNGTDAIVDGDTVFEIGSVTKVFTVLLALESASRGEVKLNDPVSKYLPPSVKMPAFDGKEITLRNLAAQDSGLPFHHSDFNDWEKKGYTLQDLKKASEAFTAADLYSFLSGYTLISPPGTKFGYSNPGMALLGHTIELMSGDKYEALIVDRICRPLGMESTRITLLLPSKARLATGHLVDGKPGGNIHLQVMQGAGAIRSTANDLLKFLAGNLQFAQTELSPLMAEMQVRRHTGASRFGNTAMPWMDEGLYQPPGSELWGHGGGGFGYLAFIGFDKARRRGVVVLSNQMMVNAVNVGWILLQGMPLTRENIAYGVREIVGLGLAINPDDSSNLQRITAVYPESPAGRAGISPGTLIQSINGIPVARRNTQECLTLLKGPEGAAVCLELVSEDQKQPGTVDLTRRKFITTSERPK